MGVVLVGWATHHHEGQGSKQPMVGWEKRKSATRAHHRMSPPDASQYRDHPTAHPGQQTGTPSTLTGAHTHHHQHTPKNHKPARENSLPPRTSSPHVPHTHTQGSPHTTLPQGYHWPTEAGGQHPHEARPARPQTEEGSTGQSHTRDEEKGQKWWGGASKHAQQGPWDRAAGSIRGPQRHQEHSQATRKTSRGSHHHPHTKAVPRHAWDTNRSQPAPEQAPTTQPHHQGQQAAQTYLPPSILNRFIFHLVRHPDAQHAGDHTLKQGSPNHDHMPPPAAVHGERAGTISSPTP